MRKISSVKKLEDLAFAACFEDILANLILAREHRPPSFIHPVTRSSIVSSNPLFTSKNILYQVRETLNQHLVGTMNDEFRMKIIQEYTRDLYNCSNKPEPWYVNYLYSSSYIFFIVFIQSFFIRPLLDCVLDENFKELSTHVAFPSTQPNSLIISTISNRAPEISSLQLNFDLAAIKIAPEFLKDFSQSLSALTMLTSLTLSQLSKKHRTILQYLGNACPQLKSLQLSGFRFNRKDLVNLMLGDCVHKLPDSTKEFLLEDDKEIHSLDIHPQFLTSFCATLEHLELQTEDFEEKKKLQASYEYTGLCKIAVAFAFRHLPNLKQFSHQGSSVSSAVKFLYQFSNSNEMSQLESENVFCDENSPPFMIWTQNSPFSGLYYYSYFYNFKLFLTFLVYFYRQPFFSQT